MQINNLWLDILYLTLTATGDLAVWLAGGLMLLGFVDGLIEGIRILKGK